MSNLNVPRLVLLIATALFTSLWVVAVHAESMDVRIKTIVDDAKSYCEGTFEVEDNAVQRLDFNSDGIIDFSSLDFYGISCDGSYGFCGSGGCSVYLMTPVDEIRSLVRGFEIVRTEMGTPVLLQYLHGNACDEVGVVPCYRAIYIHEGRFISTR